MNLPFPLSTAGHAAANLYTAGAGIRTWYYQQGWRQKERLRAKVISIGNIAWGGTGKTPFTIWLAEQLSTAGLRPSILTRGYGRTGPEPVRILSPGASAEDARTDGDEVQLYLRHLVNVPVGIAASRLEAGRAIEKRFQVDVHLLDDGFQHLSLARDLDIVLVDARNPWGARWGIARVLRESPAALRRAHAILITNCGVGETGDGSKMEDLRERLFQLNPAAPQFLATHRIVSFVERNENDFISVEKMRECRILAFCGLGSPENFLVTLNAAGIRCVALRVFRDHHCYQPEDVNALLRLAEKNRVDCLVTTEKDLVNFPAAVKLTAPLYWVNIEWKFPEELELLRWICKSLGLAVRRSTTRSTLAGLPTVGGDDKAGEISPGRLA